VRVLVLQPRRLGDVLMATPLLRALAHAGATVHVLVEAPYARALRANPHVEALVAPGGWPPLVVRLRRARYDAVVDCLGTPRTARLAWLCGARLRVGFARRWRTAFYSHPLPPPAPPVYSALEKLALGAPLGATGGDCRVEVFATGEEEREAAAFLARHRLAEGPRPVAFSPVSRRRDKAWPADRFARLCDLWHERSGWVYLPLFGPGEHEQVAAVVRASRHPGAFVFPCEPLSLGALPTVLARCRLHLGNDNAIRHVAIAAGRPTATVFARPDPRCWTPPGQDVHVAAGGRRPIDSVTVEEADAAVGRLVGRLGPVDG
jgi:heptosyltransferase III